MSCPISVQTLLEGWCSEVPDIVISGLGLDSRRISAGQAFIAVAGTQAHGLEYAPQARMNGAAVILHDGKAELPALDIPAVMVPELGSRLSALGARFHHCPSDQLAIAGVTGTNGKTSVAHFIAQSWQRTTADAGLVGTIGYGPLNAMKQAEMTTPAS